MVLHLAQVFQHTSQLLIGWFPRRDLALGRVTQEIIDGRRGDAHAILLPDRHNTNKHNSLAALPFKDYCHTADLIISWITLAWLLTGMYTDTYPPPPTSPFNLLIHMKWPYSRKHTQWTALFNTGCLRNQKKQQYLNWCSLCKRDFDTALIYH